MSAAHLTVRTRHRKDATILAVGGELDLASAPKLERAVERACESGGSLVVLDLAELSFLDVAGAHTLLSSNRRLRESGKRLGLINVQRQLGRLLSLTRASEVLRVADSLEELRDDG